MRLRAGRRLASPALVADGNHARVDGFVSLGVIASALLVGLGLPRADPLVGLTITLVILKITWDSWKTIRATEPGEPLRDTELDRLARSDEELLRKFHPYGYTPPPMWRGYGRPRLRAEAALSAQLPANGASPRGRPRTLSRGLEPMCYSTCSLRRSYAFIRTATSYLDTDVRRPGVSSVGMALSAASPRT